MNYEKRYTYVLHVPTAFNKLENEKDNITISSKRYLFTGKDLFNAINNNFKYIKRIFKNYVIVNWSIVDVDKQYHLKIEYYVTKSYKAKIIQTALLNIEELTDLK